MFFRLSFEQLDLNLRWKTERYYSPTPWMDKLSFSTFPDIKNPTDFIKKAAKKDETNLIANWFDFIEKQ